LLGRRKLAALPSRSAMSFRTARVRLDDVFENIRLASRRKAYADKDYCIQRVKECCAS